MKKALALIVLSFLFTPMVKAQGFLSKSEVHGNFELDGMYYQADDALGITDSIINGNEFGFNGFADIIYTLGNFSAGFRYEAYLPPIAGFDRNLDGQGIANLWASYTTDRFSITIGDFYEQFGNGLTLRTYTEWSLGYDNALKGARFVFSPIDGIILKGVYGVQRYFWTKYENNNRGIVKGFDAEINLNDVFNGMSDSKIKLTLGGSAVSKYQSDQNPFYKMPKNVAAFAGRFNLGINKFNFSSEYAYKINDPSAINNYIYKPGAAFIFSGSYSTKGLGIYAQFKRVDNMSYKSDQAVTSNALDINFLPPLIEAHTYMLAAMYPYATQPNGEIGFQIAINYKVPKKSKIGGKYGMGVSINYSQMNNIDRSAPNDTAYIGQSGTMGWNSDFFKFGKQIFNKDLTIEIDKKFNKKFKSTFKYIYQVYDIATIQGHTGEPMVNANIAIIDMTYKLASKKALRWELQGLWTKEDNGNWAAALIEYTVSPHWFVTITDQYNYGNKHINEKIHYYTGSFGYTLNTMRIALTYGRQREGVVCVGGVCRQVPASNGFSLTISGSF
ncbi:MAG: DUF6029 family protein [Bacteroidales bacterium]|jgi:hypothetical protein|nr:hypothetical protein [Lentimicrobiaceae bacterium]MDG1136134.1 DUF6029 family protein [Bacteroidales bacterium]MDG1902244.1 DUF6029 family protein [Bacteroidales bacterium]MDG2080206.1 DUF6029 family protein [Bacteroidales bacterium]